MKPGTMQAPQTMFHPRFEFVMTLLQCRLFAWVNDENRLGINVPSARSVKLCTLQNCITANDPLTVSAQVPEMYCSDDSFHLVTPFE